MSGLLFPRSHQHRGAARDGALEMEANDEVCSGRAEMVFVFLFLSETGGRFRVQQCILAAGKETAGGSFKTRFRGLKFGHCFITFPF